MPPILATLVFTGFVVWLFRVERSQRSPMPSALWIPLLWTLILASRPASFWFGLSPQVESMDDYLDGSPVDRYVFLALIVAGLIVLFRRNITPGAVFQANTALCALLLYWAVSTTWSDYPFVAFKRWVKEAGNVIMVLIVLTEKRPAEAIQMLLVRCAYLLIPYSVLLVKYYPELGRTYHRWTWEYMYTGVTQNKNQLGSVAMLCGVFTLWRLLERLPASYRDIKWRSILHLLVILAMAGWLLHISNSVTSLVCAILGGVLLVLLRSSATKAAIPAMELYILGAAALYFLLDYVFGATESILALFGRDMTFTERTDIWAAVRGAGVDPVIGSGFYSFWLTPYAQTITETYKGINQSHNGYLEVFLNGGMAGVTLLLCFLFSTERKVKASLLRGDSLGTIGFAIFTIVLFYNFTEATFSRFSFNWLVFLFFAVRSPVGSEVHALDNQSAGEESPSQLAAGGMPRTA